MSLRSEFQRLKDDLGELVERHEVARDLGEFERYGNDPVGFIRDVLGGDPWEAQVDIAEAVRDHAMVVVRSANAVGKDWTAARLALWWVYARRGLALVTGPTDRQVREVVMGEVARAFSKARDLPGELYTNSLRLGREETAGILAFTSTEASRLTGFHAPRVFAVLTEAQAVEDFAWEGLLSCATGAEDRLLAVGNPLSPSGRFYTASRGSGWHSLRISANDHPNLTDGRQVIPGGPSDAFVRRMAVEYGTGSGTYRARVEGEFPDEGEEGLFRRSWLEDAVARWSPEASGCPFVAVDPARYGPDSTCIATLRGDVVTTIDAWKRADLMETVDRVRRRLEELDIRSGSSEGTVTVDTVGLGAGLADRLAELGYPVVYFNGGESARESGRFLNCRAEAYWRLRQQLEAGGLALPPDEKLLDELMAVRWRETPDGRIRIEDKAGLKTRLGRSPDRADAVVMAVWAATALHPLAFFEMIEYGGFFLRGVSM